jgi:hypothetical protein
MNNIGIRKGEMDKFLLLLFGSIIKFNAQKIIKQS